jgi:hypothetical protein
VIMEMLPDTQQINAAENESRSAPLVAGRSIVAYGVRVGIQTNKPKLLDSLLARIPSIWQVSSPSPLERVFSVRVGTAGLRKRGRLLHQLLEDRQVVANSTDLDLVLEAFDRQLKIYVAEMARRRVFVHAGAVEWQGKGIVIPGRSFSGKTSLVAELVRAGATYYSDEYAVLDGRGRMHPYPAPLAIRQPDSNKQSNISAQELGGSVGAKPLPVSLIVVSRYEPGKEWHPLLLSPGKAMLELLNNTIPARRKPEAVITTLRKVVGRAVTLKGVRGEASQTAKLIFDHLVRLQ